jgi:hypothetical protein
VKRAIILIIVGAALGAGGLWMATHAGAGKPDPDEAAPKPAAADEEDKTTITHDTNGNMVVGMSDEMQGTAGIVVANPAEAEWSPEAKAYGHVIDPATLTGPISDFGAAQASFLVSSNELVRLKALDAQGNASARAFQAAEAAAVKDRLALQVARDKLTALGTPLADRAASPDFVRALSALDTVLLRADVPADQVLKSQPSSARVVRLSGETVTADYFSTSTDVNPQVQGQGFVFIVTTNSAHFASGEAVTAYLKIPGEPIKGVVVPRDAVVRTEGKGWVYVLGENGESFTRREIPLDRPAETGWFVADGLSASQHVVVTGAQVLLSAELKASMSPD